MTSKRSKGRARKPTRGGKTSGKKASAAKQRAATKRGKSATKAGATKSLAKRGARSALIGSSSGAFTILAAAPTVSVTIDRTVSPGALLSAKLNTKDLIFQGDRAHAIVARGQVNTLEWRVLGGPNVTWSVRVSEPANAACGDSGTLDHSGIEAGSCDFNS